MTSILFPSGILSIASGLLMAELWFNTYRLNLTFAVLGVIFLIGTLCSVVLAQIVLSEQCCLLDTLQVGALLFILFPAILLKIVGLLFLEDDKYVPSVRSMALLGISNTVFISIGGKYK